MVFTNFNIFPKKKEYKSEHVTLDKKTLENNLDKICFTFVDLVKFLKRDLESAIKACFKGLQILAIALFEAKSKFVKVLSFRFMVYKNTRKISYLPRAYCLAFIKVRW